VVSGQDIACPNDCQGDITQDTVVTLTAQPSATHQAGTWTGCTNTSGNTCQVTMDAAKSVSHTFREIPPDLVRLTVQTPTGGRVTGGGLNCPSKCFIDVPKGTRVTLDHLPNQYYYFIQWDGACGHTTDRQCTMTVNEPGTVRAMFGENPRYVVKVMARKGTRGGNGTVTFEGQSCDAPCEFPERLFSRDYVLSLKAVGKGRDAGGVSRLERWEGVPCGSMDTTCNVTITNNRLDITVYFRWDAG
jgi:hypothetical protein